MTKLKSVYSDVLRWGNERIDEGVSFQEFKSFVDSKEASSLSESRASGIFQELFTPIEFGTATQSQVNETIGNEGKFHLKVDAAFRFLEMQELEEARQSSKSAMKVAIFAIFIGAVVGIAQISIALIC